MQPMIGNQAKTDIVLAMGRTGAAAQARAYEIGNVAGTIAAKAALFTVAFHPGAAVDRGIQVYSHRRGWPYRAPPAK